MPSVRVLLFDVLRREIGTNELVLEVAGGATGADLLGELVDAHEPIARHRPTIRLAVNRRYVAFETVLEDGDEVALITPVSGG
ncbi:MoaD/ThiS family protein [Rubrivirga sp.]|uniref:MoaD/ThiS family protein n=1 Tax=Rubrivirga sp. TaxID=1885344 RepID=UPI003C76EB42